MAHKVSKKNGNKLVNKNQWENFVINKLELCKDSNALFKNKNKN